MRYHHPRQHGGRLNGWLVKYAVLKEQRDELLVALGRVIENMDEGDGEAPGHSHYKKCYWDKDGSKCEWCEDWNNAKALIVSAKGGAA